MFTFTESQLPGCFEIRPKLFNDSRGTFIKTLHAPTFAAQGLETNFPETFYSVSKKNVVRGLHFQTPPFDHAKLVSCSVGKIIDVVVDLRTDSPTFQKHQSFELNSESPHLIYIPRGCAHGFLAVTDDAVVTYSVSTVHAPENDGGILWSSIDFSWPMDGTPIVSPRDQAFPRMVDFESPFRFSKGRLT